LTSQLGRACFIIHCRDIMRNTLNFWGISLVTTTVAVAVAVNLESSARGSKDGVLPIKSADFLRLTENEVKFTNWESMAERKKSCAPTILCTRAGGYCVRSRADCTGVVDPHGCRRGRSCKCCIPDQTSPAPPACPSVDCTPCPTSDITTGGPTTYIPTEGPTTAITPKGPTTARNTEGPTTAETTESQNTTRTTDGPTTARITKGPITTKTTEGPTTARITEGPTAAITTEDDPTESNLPWVTVNSDQFVRLDQQASWDDARTLCRRQGLDLFEHPRDVVALSKYLDENFSS
ncbi:unnamed protein product, partial [Meganyctiphanes norvegica]